MAKNPEIHADMIQIQPMLRLNIGSAQCANGDAVIQIQPMLRLNIETATIQPVLIEFKYNQC